MNVRVVFNGKQTADGETAHTSFVAAGTLDLVPNGTKLCYTEEQDATVSVTVCGGQVLLMRRGETTTRLVLEQGKSHPCRVSTPFGVFEITARTVVLQTEFTAAGGVLRAQYTLDTGGGETQHELEILVEEVPTC